MEFVRGSLKGKWKFSILLQVIAVKQRLERDTSDLTQKLCRAEQALLAAQAKETDLTRNFEVTNAE